MKFALILPVLFSFIISVGLMIVWKKKTKISLWPFLAGAICFILFAMILESICHQFILNGTGKLSQTIISSAWLYAIYGGLAAGIFEETGRLFGFTCLLRRHRKKECAVAYGIGHGGIEAILVMGTTYLVYFLVNFGISMGDEALNEQLLAVSAQIPFNNILLAMMERVSAVLAHIGLSMMVFVAAKKRKRFGLYLLAILLHALLDFPAALYQAGAIKSLLILEGVILVMGILYLIIGAVILSRYEDNTASASSAEE